MPGKRQNEEKEKRGGEKNVFTVLQKRGRVLGSETGREEVPPL